MAITLILLFIAGAAIGSFLNVCIYRLPRHESIISPPSHCPGCDSQIAWYDNVPLVSYLLLRGKCRRCGVAISWRYPFVELLNAVLYVLAGWKFGAVAGLLPSLLLISTLIVIFFIDLDFYIIPNLVALPVAGIGLAATIVIDPSRWLELLVAGVLSAALFFLLALLIPGGMGMGDVKMVLMLGFFLGRSIVVALFLAFLLGAIVGIGLMIAGKRGRKGRIPFGPFLAVGGVVALFFGNAIMDWYLGLFS